MASRFVCWSFNTPARDCNRRRSPKSAVSRRSGVAPPGRSDTTPHSPAEVLFLFEHRLRLLDHPAQHPKDCRDLFARDFLGQLAIAVIDPLDHLGIQRLSARREADLDLR